MVCPSLFKLRRKEALGHRQMNTMMRLIQSAPTSNQCPTLLVVAMSSQELRDLHQHLIATAVVYLNL
jgi:hypothetical protein